MKESKTLIIFIVAIIACGTFYRMFRNNVSKKLNTIVHVQPGHFSECSSEIKSENWVDGLNNRTTRHFNAINTITCKCANGEIKSQVYQYFSRPSESELNCNSKCSKICSE
ncbi:MAG: hypothetical protein J6T57_02245 [Alphaproteobacteria bacterium]|nr:hypothetical protein [Alphaproteobacteria bacterium]